MAIDFNVEPFYDDFNASNGAKEQNYVRILFRPGYAVQARELTQIQSIIQNQIKQFGDHIFKNGSPVFGGHITYDLNVPYIKLQTAYNGADVDVEDYENAVIRNVAGTSKARARVIATDDTQTYPTLMVKYLRGTRFIDNEVISNAESGGNEAKLLASSATGIGSVATIQPGVFYVDGYFVQVPQQSIVLDPYASTPSYKVGLEIVETIIDESADANLLDPAQQSFNYQAPGAHRYQFSLDLAKRALDSVDDTKFFELLRIENGVITKQVKYPIYSELEKTLARRTYDESGDYTVSPFKVAFEANTSTAAGNTDSFIAVVAPGKAYVKGFEYEAIGPQRLTIPKARTTQISTDYDLSLEYGNYLYANSILASNTSGFLNSANLPTLELHCVPKNSVNLTNAITYNATFMGSAKLKHITRNSGEEFIVYLSDMQLTSNTVTAGTTGANTLAINFPVNYANIANAYQNVSVRITSGASSGDVRRIVDYNSTTRVGVVDVPFTGLIGSGQTFSLLYSTRDIDSLIQANAAKTAFNVSMNVSNNSKDVTGRTIVYDSNRKTLLFKFPDVQIERGSIDNADYVTNRFFEAQSFNSSGVSTLTLTGNEVLDFGSDGSTISSTLLGQNFIFVIKTLGTATAYSGNSTPVANGQIFTPSSVTRTSSTGLSITSGINGSFTADIYVRVKMENSENSGNNVRSKTRVGNVANTTLLATDSYTPHTTVTGCTSVYIDSSNGRIWFTDPASTINKTSGGNTSLYIPDVYKLIKVYTSGNPAYMPNTTNAIDVTNNFMLDTGQTAEYYDHSKLVLKPGRTAPSGQTVVFVEYYQHATTTGYFSVDSYPETQYSNGQIGIFKSGDGVEYVLRDCIDFRPTRTLGTTANTFFGARIPLPYEPMELTYEYYLPRRDKIVLTSSKELKVVSGIPNKDPKYPPDQSDAMTLFTMDIPAYTSSHTHVTARALDHKRYTMRDIGKLEQRIRNVEYYSALTLAETKAKDSAILYEDNATQKEKYGIIVDNFTGFKVGDSTSGDFVCSIDGGKLKPYAKTTNINLVPQSKTYTKPDYPTMPKKVMWTIPGTEKIINAQTAATKNTAIIPPVLAGKFEGDVNLFPSTDHYYSVMLPPVLNSDTEIVPPPSIHYVPELIKCDPPVKFVEPPPVIDVYSPVLDTRVEPVLPPAVPVPAIVFEPVAPPAYLIPTQTVDPPTAYPQIVMDPVPYPDPATIGQVLVLPQPPAPVSPPTPPPIYIDGVGTISLIDFVPPPLDPIPADITGLAPIVSTVDTWYAAPVSTDPEISIGGGGMLRDLVYEDRIALH
jgi:hypothetical protein